jgi:arabinofuranosyltransferase
MVKQFSSRNRQLVLLVGYLLVAILILLTVMSEFRLDDSFITYRYSRNFAQGIGLVYNAGDDVLSTTAPLYAILLGILSFVIPDFHLLGNLIGTLSIGLGGWLIYNLLPRRMSESIRLWGGLIYVLSSPLWLALGMETAFWIMLVLAAIWLIQEKRWAWGGLLIGLAALSRPDAILPAGLLGLMLIATSVNSTGTSQRWWQPVIYYGVAAIIPILIFAVWAYATYGSPFPVTLGAKNAQAILGITGLGVDVTTWEGLRLILRSLMVQSPLYIALALLVLFGCTNTFSASMVIVVAWGALHLLAYMLLKVAPYRWYYAPLVPGAVLLAASGLDYLLERLRIRRVKAASVLVAAIAVFPLIAQVTSFSLISQRIQNGGPVDVMLPIVDWQAYRETGEWLDKNTPSNATVGVAEVGQIGFYARRYMTDYLGLLQPDVAAGLKRDDFYSWLVGYAPDYLVFQRFRGAALVLYNYVIQDDKWFNANYQPVTEFDDARYSSGPVTIFKRVTNKLPITPQPVQLDYGGLHLVGVASDANAIPTNGGSVRVRLDWEVVGILPDELHIAVKGLSMAGGNPSFDGDYHTPNWHGRFSTWHGFVVPNGVTPGTYTLLVAVGPKGGPYNEQGVGTLQVARGP